MFDRAGLVARLAARHVSGRRDLDSMVLGGIYKANERCKWLLVSASDEKASRGSKSIVQYDVQARLLYNYLVGTLSASHT